MEAPLKIKNIRFFALFLSVAALGCVTPAKFHALEDENNLHKDRLALCEDKVAELEGKLGIASSERTKLSDEKTKLSASVTEMKQALEELQKRKQEAEKRLTEFRELTARFKKLVDAGKLKIKFMNGKMVLALSTDILFPSGSAALSPAGKQAIKEVTGLLATLKERNFQIEGHTDNVPILTKKQFDSNWELASARAMTVLNTMLEGGMPAERISAASYGETQPIASNKTTEGKSANRRIAIVVVPDLTGLPGFEELNKMASDK
jgi:chemotaxis protein MotB